MQEIIDVYGDTILALIGIIAACLLIGGVFVIFRTSVIAIFSKLFILG